MGQGKISAKQQEILEYIKHEILKKGYPPAVREICDAVHLKSTSQTSISLFSKRLFLKSFIFVAKRRELPKNTFVKV